jgi:large subunit ribosomal protein L18
VKCENMTYNLTLKRNRQLKTNYRKRASLLLSRRDFVVVKISDQNVSCQFLKPNLKGDIVISSSHSRELRKYGWKGSMNSLPACYLTGLLLGKKSIAKGTDNAILYTGRDSFTSRIAACLKGIVAAGVNVPVSKDSLPSDERTNGKHIAEYAKILKGDQAKYNSIFSALIKEGLNPEEYPSHFEATKEKISENFSATAKSEQ